MISDTWKWRLGCAGVVFLVLVARAPAATSFSNSLTGFTGSSTLPATQAALATAGFNFSDLTSDTAAQFDANGVSFDVMVLGNDGRNYIRTIEDDYANVSFVAEITFDAPSIDSQDAYFGLGAGNAVASAFRTPDWTSLNSSVMFWGESEINNPSVDTFLNDNGSGPFVTTAAPALADGIHRVRLSYDWFQKAATFSFDFNYAGGPFAADTTAAVVSTLGLYGADGWTNEPARLFFGGDDAVIFKDFQVTVSTPEMLLGDFNSSGAITSADWAILRDNQHTNLSGLTFSQAYFLGDLTSDKANNHADFVLFKTLYDEVNGAGSFAVMAAAVPEPASLSLIVLAGGMATFFRQRGERRT